jgi:glycosyltransferase involved in cell wall biosynthesis
MEIIMSALKQLPDAWLMVMGPKNLGVLSQARSFGIEDRLWQTDFIPESDLSWYLACADLMCLPLTDHVANRGRLPGKIMYYIAAGRPIVASPVGDVKTIIETHNVGLLASDDSFAEALNQLLTDSTLREELGHNARRAAETVFNWEHRVNDLETFYRRILDSAL